MPQKGHFKFEMTLLRNIERHKDERSGMLDRQIWNLLYTGLQKYFKVAHQRAL